MRTFLFSPLSCAHLDQTHARRVFASSFSTGPPPRETEAQLTAAGMSSQNYQTDAFRFKRAAFLQSRKSKIGLAASKAAALRINLNIQGCGVVAMCEWVCVCVCVCVRVRVHKYMHTYMHTDVCVCVNTALTIVFVCVCQHCTYNCFCLVAYSRRSAGGWSSLGLQQRGHSAPLRVRILKRLLIYIHTHTHTHTLNRAILRVRILTSPLIHNKNIIYIYDTYIHVCIIRLYAHTQYVHL